MIAVEVGDDDDVDRVAVDAGGLQIVGNWPLKPLLRS